MCNPITMSTLGDYLMCFAVTSIKISQGLSIGNYNSCCTAFYLVIRMVGHQYVASSRWMCNPIWLVVWNMNFMTFHILGTIIPFDWYVSEGLKPPTVHKMRIWFFKLKFHFYDMVVVVSTVCISIIVKPPSRCSQALRCSNHRLRSCGIVSLPLIWMNNHDTSQ